MTVDYDAELARYSPALRRAWAVQPDDRVLDVGCGAGWTTREAARTAVAGSVLGVDLSAPAVGRARDLAAAEGLRNVAFECADAQTHTFVQGYFTLAISRFGTMFFADPVAAFTTIGQALRPAGRLVMLVWQAQDRNEWSTAIREALAEPTASGPTAFSLADPGTTEGILRAAGFTGVEFTAVEEPVHYGPDVAAALDWIRGFTCTDEFLKQHDPAAVAGVLERLRDACAARLTDDGVWFGSSAWIVTAHKG